MASGTGLSFQQAQTIGVEFKNFLEQMAFSFNFNPALVGSQSSNNQANADLQSLRDAVQSLVSGLDTLSDSVATLEDYFADNSTAVNTNTIAIATNTAKLLLHDGYLDQAATAVAQLFERYQEVKNVNDIQNTRLTALESGSVALTQRDDDLTYILVGTGGAAGAALLASLVAAITAAGGSAGINAGGNAALGGGFAGLAAAGGGVAALAVLLAGLGGVFGSLAVTLANVETGITSVGDVQAAQDERIEQIVTSATPSKIQNTLNQYAVVECVGPNQIDLKLNNVLLGQLQMASGQATTPLQLLTYDKLQFSSSLGAFSFYNSAVQVAQPGINTCGVYIGQLNDNTKNQVSQLSLSNGQTLSLATGHYKLGTGMANFSSLSNTTEGPQQSLLLSGGTPNTDATIILYATAFATSINQPLRIQFTGPAGYSSSSVEVTNNNQFTTKSYIDARVSSVSVGVSSSINDLRSAIDNIYEMEIPPLWQNINTAKNDIYNVQQNVIAINTKNTQQDTSITAINTLNVAQNDRLSSLEGFRLVTFAGFVDRVEQLESDTYNLRIDVTAIQQALSGGSSGVSTADFNAMMASQALINRYVGKPLVYGNWARVVANTANVNGFKFLYANSADRFYGHTPTNLKLKQLCGGTTNLTQFITVQSNSIRIDLTSLNTALTTSAYTSNLLTSSNYNIYVKVDTQLLTFQFTHNNQWERVQIKQHLSPNPDGIGNPYLLNKLDDTSAEFFHTNKTTGSSPTFQAMSGAGMLSAGGVAYLYIETELASLAVANTIGIVQERTQFEVWLMP